MIPKTKKIGKTILSQRFVKSFLLTISRIGIVWNKLDLFGHMQWWKMEKALNINKNIDKNRKIYTVENARQIKNKKFKGNKYNI